MKPEVFSSEYKQKFIKLSSNSMFIDNCISLLDSICPIKKGPSTKYSNKDYFIAILDVFERFTYWSDYKGNIKWKTLHNKFRVLIKLNFFEIIFKNALTEYLQKNKSEKLKYQLIDSTAIINKQGKELIDFGHKGGKKRITNVSLICDSFGAPLAVHQFNGSRNDSTTIKETLNKIPINLKTEEASENNKHKRYFLADSGYCSIENRKMLNKRKYVPLIWYNKRNTKNAKILNKKKFNKTEQEIYKKRRIVESTFSWIKKFPKINCLYEKTSSSFTGLLFLASSYILINKT